MVSGADKPDTNPAVPEGTICLILRGNYVLGIGCCFDRSRPGGFTLEETQETWARNEAARDFVRKQCTPLIADVMELHHCKQLVARLRGKGLIRVEIERVGGEEEGRG